MAVRETGSEMQHNALWDCFGDAVAFFTRYYEVSEETEPEK